MVIYGMNGNGSALQRGLLLLHPLNRKVLHVPECDPLFDQPAAMSPRDFFLIALDLRYY
jgi:hypothetical protein